MHYLFEKGSPNGKKLLLLHGTGGDEYSLIDIAHFLAPNSTLLSFRGSINEDGMNRFFKRNGLNQFDYESLEEESTNLHEEIKKISKNERIPLSDWIVVGYSNGANIAAHLMLESQTGLKTGLFFHTMSLGNHQQSFSLADKKIWLSYSEDDPIVSSTAISTLINELETRHAQLTVTNTNTGHQLTMEELSIAKEWLDKNS